MQGSPPALVSHDLPRALEWLVSLRPQHAWIFVLLCLDIAVFGDLVTGTKVWFGPGYLLVICLAAWCLGWRAGLATGLGCSALSFALNGVVLYPHGDAEVLRNFAARFIAIAVVIAVVAGSRRAYLREWWLARTDLLTGAFNRQAFFELADKLATSANWRLLLYADLDGLKCINDMHGHSSGDLALRAFADVVRRNIRREDLFARVGGDEFLVFITIKDQESGEAVAERLHSQMNCIPSKHGGLSHCSLGALIVPPGEMSVDHLVHLADAAMYRAKEEGAALEIELATGSSPAAQPGRARKTRREARNAAIIA